MATPNRTRDRRVSVAARRARVAELLRDNLAQTEIARRLEVSKDTIWRDVKAILRDTSRTTETFAERRARRVAEAEGAMRDIADAVAQVIAARPSHAIVADHIAHQWESDLREYSAALVALAEAFTECYPQGGRERH
ncbi:HTH domain-containing protein [Streptomyces sp. NPDC001889]